jgi:hypothetical protein
LTIQFQYTPEILQRAHELHYRKFLPLRGKLLLFLGLLSAWAGVLLLIASQGKNLWYGIPLVIYGVFAVASHFYMKRNIGQRAFTKLSDYHDPMTIEIDEDLVAITIRDHRNEIPWADLKKGIITDQMILLYPNDKVFFIFPKERFSGDDYSDFTALVKRKIEKLA